MSTEPTSGIPPSERPVSDLTFLHEIYLSNLLFQPKGDEKMKLSLVLENDMLIEIGKTIGLGWVFRVESHRSR